MITSIQTRMIHPFLFLNDEKKTHFPTGWVSRLGNEVLLNVEEQTVVVVLYLAQLQEVQTCRGAGVRQQVHRHRSLRRFDNHTHRGKPIVLYPKRIVVHPRLMIKAFAYHSLSLFGVGMSCFLALLPFSILKRFPSMG